MEKRIHTKSIHLENLAVGYSGKHQRNVVAKGISADLYAGELTCLLGANGIGKSTLLRTLAAFQPRLEGDIQLLGKSIDQYGKRNLASVLSVVLTEKCEIRNMTVEEVTGLGRSPYTGFWGRLSGEDRRMVYRAMNLVGIAPLASRMIDTLSDGERQKVMIARALVQDTPVIFLDEPTSFLDFPSKVEMMQLLHRLSRMTQKTIFLSTHDMELALQLADKVWLMTKEQGVVTGTPEDLALDGTLEHYFQRKGIVFSRQDGVFKVAHECAYEIGLTGEGIKYDMVKKALLRNGYAAVSRKDTPYYIQIDSEIIRLFHEQQEVVACEKIEPLLDKLLADNNNYGNGAVL